MMHVNRKGIKLRVVSAIAELVVVAGGMITHDTHVVYIKYFWEPNSFMKKHEFRHRGSLEACQNAWIDV